MILRISYLSNEELLRKLKYILNYQLSASIMLVLMYGGFLTIIITSLAAILFTPFLIYALLRTNKKGWLIFFVILIFLPPLAFLIVSGFNFYFRVLVLTELGVFYFYCFLIRLVVVDWEEQNSWKKVREEQKENDLLQKRIFEFEMNRKGTHEK